MMRVQNYARLAGILVLISLVAGGFGEAYVPSKLIVSRDAAATAANLKQFDFLFRLGFAGFLIESLCDLTLALVFYVLLKPVSKNLSLLAAFFAIVSTTLFAVAEFFYFAAPVIIGSGANGHTFTPEQLQSIALLFLKLYGYGAAVFAAYYGVCWLVRSYLIFVSGYLPKFLGVLMGIGGLGFVVKNFLVVLAPAYASDLWLLLLFPGTLLLTGWLLVKGVDVPKWQQRTADLPT